MRKKINPTWLHCPSIQKLISVFGEDRIRFVGGAVRDAVLGINSNDIDAATTLPPLETMELLENAGIRTIPTGIAHGTITALIDGKTFEITSLRLDIACDGRHAEVAFGTDWQKDAARRDFTINALYLAANGEIFDYFGGVDDVWAGRLRFIGDARLRIREDYLRILRFFRFFAIYGKNAPDAEAITACTEFAAHLAEVSGERIQQEMLKLLAVADPFPTLALMQNCGVFVQVFGFNCSNYSHKFISGSSTVCLALLLLSADISSQDALQSIHTKWRISNVLHNSLALFIGNIKEIYPQTSIARQKQLLRKLGVKNFTELVQLKNAISAHASYQKMQDLTIDWQIPTFPITGGDLLAIGIPAGKNLGEKLRELEKIWEESNYQMSKEALLKH
jgi:poly(A) polymerase